MFAHSSYYTKQGAHDRRYSAVTAKKNGRNVFIAESFLAIPEKIFLANWNKLHYHIICNINFNWRQSIATENTNAAVRENDGPRINREIKAKEVRLINYNGENAGVVSLAEALKIAQEVGLDLIEISPQVTPPVCKILDYGKYKYEMQKKKNEAKKNQKVVSVKELKLRPMIDTHDYEVKVKQAKKFLSQGDKVKFTMRYKGRRMSANDLGKEILISFGRFDGLCQSQICS